jgi:mono/diheme cytochrome c family protein
MLDLKARSIVVPWVAVMALAVGLLGVAAISLGEDLRSPDEITAGSRAERSQALFVEAGKVLLHPRCINCHPSGEEPLQGDDEHRHQPLVERGAGGHGRVGMMCSTCHGSANFDPGRVPGAPGWRLAPASMAWEGRSLREICEGLKDPERNGDRSLSEIVHHMQEDALVGWAWKPGADREPAPGTQEALGKLIRVWADTGAVCPE